MKVVRVFENGPQLQSLRRVWLRRFEGSDLLQTRAIICDHAAFGEISARSRRERLIGGRLA